MITGYVTVVDSNSPLPAIPPVAKFYRKTAVKLITSPTQCKDRFEFSISIEGTHNSFKVVRNVREVDKQYISKGLVRIGFVRPKVDIVILCKPGELKAFVYTIEIVHNLKEPTFTHRKCSSKEYCSFHERSDGQCERPTFQDAICRNGDDISGSKLGTLGVNGTSYPYLRTINASGNGLIELPEALALLPCLSVLDLSANRLGQATNWNWLTSPFIRENLRELYLDRNGFFNFPEAIFELKNLTVLSLNENYLSELPDASGNLKCLRYFHIGHNKLLILPSWMYRKERFSRLTAAGNYFQRAISVCNTGPRLNRQDFEIVVPSLFTTVATFIITRRFAYWKYNIPAFFTNYLEGAYHCRCGSVVFCDSIGRVVLCSVMTRILAICCDHPRVPVAIRCCSYECYRLIEQYDSAN